MSSVSSDGGTSVIIGHAYQRRATIELAGDTLTWRAQRGQLSPLPENIVTTIHDVRDVRWLEQRWSLAGTALCALGIVWAITESLLWGAGTVALGAALLVWRLTHPRLFLVLDVGDHRLVMKVAPPSRDPARALVDRIDHAVATDQPPALP